MQAVSFISGIYGDVKCLTTRDLESRKSELECERKFEDLNESPSVVVLKHVACFDAVGVEFAVDLCQICGCYSKAKPVDVGATIRSCAVRLVVA